MERSAPAEGRFAQPMVQKLGRGLIGRHGSFGNPADYERNLSGTGYGTEL